MNAMSEHVDLSLSTAWRKALDKEWEMRATASATTPRDVRLLGEDWSEDAYAYWDDRGVYALREGDATVALIPWHRVCQIVLLEQIPAERGDDA